MAIVENLYTGNGSTTLYSFTFPYLDESHVKVTLNGTPTTAYVFASATSLQFTSAPGAGVAIRIYRETDDTDLEATFFPGSSIRASDLNNDFDQLLYLGQESSSIAGAATTTANTALTNSNTAISTANSAVSTANGAVSTANAAVVTANTAESNSLAAISTASSAVSTANSAVSTANNALSNSNTAINTANAAAAAVASAVLYQPVLDLVALALLTPNDGEFFELQDSTGAESDPSITGVPIGLVGDTGLSFRLRYDDPPGEYVFLEYFATDSETRYAVKATEADATQALSDAAAAQGDATQALLDAAAAQGDATQALSDAAAAQSTANAALPASGGTLTGDVVLANQTDIRFGEATVNGSNYVGFQAPASITSDVLWTLPATDAAVSGYALKSDGSGNLSWGLAGGALGGGTDQVFYENDQTVTTNYTLGTNKNAVTAGPITINSGVTVTVPAGQSWVIV